MIIAAFTLAFLFCTLGGAHISLILECRRDGRKLQPLQYGWTLMSILFGLYWLTVLAGN